MSAQLNESLSAVVDGEASSFETRRVLDELQRSDDLSARWHRYHLIGAALRREGEDIEHRRALDRLWQEVDGSSEGTVPAPAVGARQWRLGRLTAAAVAASVALTVVVAFYPDGRSPLPDGAAAVGMRDGLASVAPLFGDTVAAGVERADARVVRTLPNATDVRRMQAYMLRHAHHMALSQRAAGSVPFVKVAAFEGR
jgi:sigma-E factor negative regulatory protein RseA